MNRDLHVFEQELLEGHLKISNDDSVALLRGQGKTLELGVEITLNNGTYALVDKDDAVGLWRLL